MKKKYLIIAILALVGMTHFFSFTTKTPEQILKELTHQFHEGLNDLEVSIEQLHQAILDLDGSPSSVEALRTIHINNRNNFKKIEFLLEYNDAEGTKKMLNGAPLPTVEPNVPEVVRIEPKGLQVLDELIFEDEIDETQQQELLSLSGELRSDFSKIKKYQASVKLSHRNFFEAVRFELIRIFTLGVTGFDTPGSGNAISEATTAMESITLAISAYYPLVNPKDMKLVEELKALFAGAKQFLENAADFDSFDRLTFLKAYINPLYEKTYRLHRLLGIETSDELRSIPIQLNYHANNIFNNEFLNLGVFANTDLSSPNTPKRRELGRLLFFDPILSHKNERSCASCHHPEKGFTDGLPKSVATDGQGTVARNAMTVLNSIYAEKFFYDHRIETIEKQTKHVIHDKKEFNTDMVTIMRKLEQSSTYRQLFKEAFGDMGQYYLSPTSITTALSVYVASLSSFNSPFDKYVRGEMAEIDPAVKRGFNIFMGKGACGTCHFAPTFNGAVPPFYSESETEVLGIPTKADTMNLELDPDLGRYASGYPRDRADFFKYSFKTVTVRNVALTAPYMHNGVYNTLEEVVDFYNRGGGAGMGLPLDHQTLPFDHLNLSKQEQADLVAFMEALTDNPFADDVPKTLPTFENNPEWNKRKIGGVY